MSADKSNSLSQPEAIAQLKQTIAQLETIVTQLDDTSVIDLPSSDSIQDLETTASKLQDLINQASQKPEPSTEIVTPVKEDSKPPEKKAVAEVAKKTPPQKPSSPPKTQPESKKTADSTSKKPSKKPESKTVPKPEAKSSNSLPPNKPTEKQERKWLVPGIITLVAVIIIPLAWYFTSSNPSTSLVADNTSLDLPVLETPIEQISDDNQDASLNEETPTQVDSLETAETLSDPEPDLDIPEELVAESRPKKVNLETVTPKLKLTPEQNLIAALDRKITNLADDFESELIVSIKPDFSRDLVWVTFTDDWYELPENRQDKVLNEMFKRSRQLQFTKLKIIDSQENLLARSPVVGKQMVIFRRNS